MACAIRAATAARMRRIRLHPRLPMGAAAA
jgi:hypothetical protein